MASGTVVGAAVAAGVSAGGGGVSVAGVTGTGSIGRLSDTERTGVF
jgi:hypothetical protein